MYSPSVQTKEITRQSYIPTITSEVGVFVGNFERGPINIPIKLSDVNDFKFLFGRPTKENYNEWYQVYNFLQYSSSIIVMRTCGEIRTNANNGGFLTIDNHSQWRSQYNSISATPVRYIARTPGSWGNLLSIGIITYNEWLKNVEIGFGVNAKDVFTFFEDKYLGICIFRDGYLVEKFYKHYSNIEDLNNESKYIYVKNSQNNSVINTITDFAYYYGILDLGLVPSAPISATDLGFLTGLGESPNIDLGSITNRNILIIKFLTDFINSSGILDLGRISLPSTQTSDLGFITDKPIGQNIDLGYLFSFDEYIAYGNSLIRLVNGSQDISTKKDFENSYNLLKNPDEIDFDIIIGNDICNDLAINLAEERKDCIAFVGIPVNFIGKLILSNKEINNQNYQSGNVIDLDSFRPNENNLLQISNYIKSLPKSQFAHFTLDIKVQYDQFSNKYKLVNVAGDAAGLKAKASIISAWSISAGLERGRIKNIEKTYLNLSKKQKDFFYKIGANFIENNTFMTQKTFLDSYSKFSKVSVRSLVNHIEKECRYILRKYAFEENTLNLRKNIASQIKNYLTNIRTNNGIEGAKINVYSGKNNEIIVEIIVQPKFSAEKIKLNIVNTGANDLNVKIQ